MKDSCKDFRFGNCNLTTRYSYWIESGINTATTKVWVKLPALAEKAMDTFYMHYNNTAAAIPSPSKFDNTFPPATPFRPTG